MNPFRSKLVRPVTLAIFIGLVSTQLSFCNSHPLINIDPSTQVSQYGGPYYGFNEAHADAMIGYTFYLQQAITITQVGWYDEERDGLSRDFQVGLWLDDGSGFANAANATQLLGDPEFGIIIPAGTGTSLNGVWRVINLATSLTLQPGYYELGGLNTATTTDVIKYALDTGIPSTTSVQLQIGQFFYDDWGHTQSGFQVVNYFYLANGLEMGPMLFSNVPEPSTVALSGLSAVAMLLFRRRRQN